MSKGDLYRVLNVSRTASLQEIKIAYRKLALKFHPDTCQNMDRAQAEERFKHIATAYQTLSDMKRREEYDVQSVQGGSDYVGGDSKTRHANWDPAKKYGNGPFVRVDIEDFGGKYNAAEWYAAHYGEPSPPPPSSYTETSSWMRTDSAHQRYYQRKERGKKINIDLEEEEASSSHSQSSHTASARSDAAHSSADYSSADSSSSFFSHKKNTKINENSTSGSRTSAEDSLGGTVQEAVMALHRKRQARILRRGRPESGSTARYSTQVDASRGDFCAIS